MAVQPAVSKTLQSPVVTTKSGKIQGKRILHGGSCLDLYYGIPYAMPPTGDRRFQTTVPVEIWDGILNATKKPSACPQAPVDAESLDKESVQSEDCLYLNIWAPCDKKPKAVMVWIYGGNLIQGSASMSLYDGSKIAATGNVIVAAMNYRLGVLGFAYSGTEDAPGNAGMYDQAEALKWIHDNIENFGGNSSSITLFGESSGAISISMHTLSPLTSNFFHRVIMESGSTALLVFPLARDLNLLATQSVATAVGCSSLEINLLKQPKDVIDCMKKTDALILANFTRQFVQQYGDSFMPEDPRLLIIEGKSKNCDRIVLVNADEGSLVWTTVFMGIYGLHGEKVRRPTLKKVEARAMILLILSGLGIPPVGSNLIIEHYLSKVQGDDNEEVLRQAYTAAGDALFVCPSVYEAEQASRQKNAVFFSQFSHRSGFPASGVWEGVPHLSELRFVFGKPEKVRFTKKEAELSRRVIKMWTDFAKTGSPNSDEMSWPLYSEKQPSYLILNTTERFEIGEGPHRDNCDLFRPFYGFSSLTNVTNLKTPDIGKVIKSLI